MKENVTTDMRVHDNENIATLSREIVVLPLPVLDDGASNNPAKMIPPIEPHGHFAPSKHSREKIQIVVNMAGLMNTNPDLFNNIA